eukprot:1158427-Pelagomonas_calceolata.AAC.7
MLTKPATKGLILRAFMSSNIKTPGPRISLRPPAAALESMSPSFKGLSSSHPPYHSVRCGQGHLHPSHLEPLKELGLDSHTAIKLVLKLHVHSVQCAYKLVSTRRALEKKSFNSQAWATANNPPDPH